jgi:hypothetical protein
MRSYFSVAMFFLLCSCGLHTPEISEAWDGRGIPENRTIHKPPATATTQIEFEIRRKIYCELKDAVQHVNSIPLRSGDALSHLTLQRLMIPREWIAQISLSLQVDEATAFSPGASYNDVLHNATKVFGVGSANTVTVGQSFNLGFGGTLSSTATRIDKFNPTYSIDWLMRRPRKDEICQDGNDIFHNQYPRSSPFLIESDLGIDRWLMGAMLTENLLPSRPPTKVSATPSRTPAAAAEGGGSASGGGSGGGSLGPFSVSAEFKFVIISSGNVTPTWKLIQWSANTSGTLFSMGRTRTHDLIITVGPPTGDTTSANFSLQVQSAVANGVRSGLGQ